MLSSAPPPFSSGANVRYWDGRKWRIGIFVRFAHDNSIAYIRRRLGSSWSTGVSQNDRIKVTDLREAQSDAIAV